MKYPQQPLPTVEEWSERLELKKTAARSYAGPCPLCGGTDRFHVSGHGDRCLVGCRGCIDGEPPKQRSIRFKELLAQVFPDRINKIDPTNKTTRYKPLPPAKPAAAQVHNPIPALLWKNSISPDNTPAHIFILRRGLWPPQLPLSLIRPLRWLPKHASPKRQKRWPGLPPHCTGALIVNYTNDQKQAVYLEAFDSQGKHIKDKDAPRWRRTLGSPAGSMAILQPPFLEADKQPPVIVEGITTALGALWLYPGHPIISLGSYAYYQQATPILAKLHNNYIIDADGDPHGRDATLKLHTALKAENISSSLILRARGDTADTLASLTLNPDKQAPNHNAWSNILLYHAGPLQPLDHL